MGHGNLGFDLAASRKLPPTFRQYRGPFLNIFFSARSTPATAAASRGDGKALSRMGLL
jgi:hypothetical protein